MKHILIGQIVNTHGLKGELRIVSEFPYKDLIFKKGFKFFVGKRKDECAVNTYRRHKIYDMVTFEGIDNIDVAIAYKGDYVYINREDLEVDGYINEDIIDFDVYCKEKFIGKLTEVINNGAHDILVINDDKNRNLVPFVDEYVKKVDLDKKTIIIEPIEGLIYED